MLNAPHSWPKCREVSLTSCHAQQCMSTAHARLFSNVDRLLPNFFVMLRKRRTFSRDNYWRCVPTLVKTQLRGKGSLTPSKRKWTWREGERRFTTLQQHCLGNNTRKNFSRASRVVWCKTYSCCIPLPDEISLKRILLFILKTKSCCNVNINPMKPWPMR